jgi:hypothetical protein
MRRGIERVPRHPAARCLIAIIWAAAAQADDTSTARLRDLDTVQRDYVDQSPAFSAAARGQAHALIADLRGRVPAMTDAQFVFALARIAGIADNGHDTIHVGEGGWWPSLRLPVRMIWFDDALLIARASPDAGELLGASVLELEGVTPADLMERLRPLQGDLGLSEPGIAARDRRRTSSRSSRVDVETHRRPHRDTNSGRATGH